MKILFISGANGPDYLSDMVFHGLRSLFGTDVVDEHRLWYMYKSAGDLRGLYGKAFTLYGLIDEGQVDRNDISAKVRAQFFDLVIFGSIWRYHEDLAEVSKYYPKSKIILLDGEDGPEFLVDGTKAGIYFKRELYTATPGIFPIQFAIPEEKIAADTVKTDFLAAIDPMNRATYVYDDEKSYYAGYASSMFGKTMKKAGWDCLRHYEIMANGCLPYFTSLEHCPATIMQFLPKEELLVAKHLLDYKGFDFFNTPAGHDLWARLMERIHATLKQYLTTTALAKYVIDTVGKVT